MIFEPQVLTFLHVVENADKAGFALMFLFLSVEDVIIGHVVDGYLLLVLVIC